MMRSMFAGVSGLRTHQTMMDVLSSNISNVNTFGYRAQRTTFKDALTQNLAGAAAPSTNLGGTNPRQVGLGMTLNSIDSLMTQGNAQSTGVVTDLAIQGDGFFRVSLGSNFTGNNLNAGAGEFFTRAGNFKLDSVGNIITNSGANVIYGPGLNNWDIGVHKLIYLGEKKNLEIRMETFNTWNHPQLKGPAGVNWFNNTPAGEQIANAADQRQIQFALRFNF